MREAIADLRWALLARLPCSIARHSMHQRCFGPPLASNSASKSRHRSAVTAWTVSLGTAMLLGQTQPTKLSVQFRGGSPRQDRANSSARRAGSKEAHLTHPPCPTSGNNGRLCSQARHTSEIVPARPPMTMQASPDSAINRLRASPMPLGITTVAGQSAAGISPGGMMLTTRQPPAVSARSAATRVAGLPQPLTTVIPSFASSAPASPASSYAVDPGSALPRMQT